MEEEGKKILRGKKIKKFNLKKSLINITQPIASRPYKTLAAVFVFWILERQWGFEAGFFVSLFFLFLLLKLDYRILFFFALLFLAGCPFYLVAENQFYAEKMAIFAYYLLFIGTVLSLIEHIFLKNKSADE